MSYLKSYKSLLILFFSFLLMLVSCRSDSNDNTVNSTNFYLKAKFNGTEKSFQNVFGYGRSLGDNMQIWSINIQYNLLNKTGNPYPGVFLEISPNAYMSTGTFNEDNAYVNFEYRASEVNFYTAANYTPKDFTFTITEFSNKRIRGTFHGTLQNNDGEKIVVENGEFYGYEKN